MRSRPLYAAMPTPNGAAVLAEVPEVSHSPPGIAFQGMQSHIRSPHSIKASESLQSAQKVAKIPRVEFSRDAANRLV